MRKNIWEINEKYFCPIAGFCLTYEEQSYILNKYVSKENQKSIEQIIHDFLIAGMSKESKLAKHIQKILNKKYRKRIIENAGISNESWIKNAYELINCEDYGAFIWISALHLNLTETENDLIIHKIHMYNHKMFFELQYAQKQLSNMYYKCNVIVEKYRDIRKKQKNYYKELSGLKKINKELSNSNVVLKDKITWVESDVIEKENREIQIVSLKQQLELKEQQIKELKRDNKKLNNKSDSQAILLSKAKQEFENIIKTIKLQQSKCNTCSKVDLCQRRVLIVGGLTKMKAFYKKMIDEMGGQFNYHDGYCYQDETELSNLIKKSDIVLCPVDINSHAACLQVKKNCKKTGTDFYMLRKSSMSSVYNTLLVAANA